MVSDIKRGRAARNAKLASLPVGMAGRAAMGFGKRLTGKSKDEVNAELMDKAAQQLFTVLGELKGGAMKVGQALSVMEAAIPEQYGKPYREALTKLQREAPPMPAARVHRVLDAQLGTKWRDRFASFDDKAVASASIGQVHKAVWADGREVAVKIQYPGADEALRADLKTMQRMVGVLKQLSPGADVQGVVDELIERTEMELDYRLEADNQRAFAKAYEGDPHFVVPHIVASAPKVVIQEWIEGIPLSHIIRDGTQEQRDLMATRLFEFSDDAPRRLEMVHGDAHPGNFMLLPGPAKIYTSYVIPNNQIFFTIILKYWIELYSWLAAPATYAFRLPSFLFGIGVLGIICFRWRKRLGTPAAMTAALTLSCSIPFIIYSTAIRGYMLSFLLLALILEAGYSFRKNSNWKAGLLYAVCSYLAVLTIPTNIIGIGALVLFLLFEFHRKKLICLNSLYLAASPLIALLLAYAPIWEKVAGVMKLREGWGNPWSVTTSVYLAVLYCLLPLVIIASFGLLSKRRRLIKDYLKT